MRTHRSTLALATLFALAFMPFAAAADDAADIEAAIVAGYVEGVHKNQDADAIRKGLHDKFVMSILRDGEVSQLGRDEWIDRIEEGKKNRPADAPRPEIGYDFTLLDQSGDAAVAKIDLHRDGKHVFTDYMAVYRFEDGWKIVGKTFQSHR